MANEEEHKCPPHFWIIDSDGVGRCKFCPAVKDFREQGRKTAEHKATSASRGGSRTKKGITFPRKVGRPSKYE